MRPNHAAGFDPNQDVLVIGYAVAKAWWRQLCRVGGFQGKFALKPKGSFDRCKATLDASDRIGKVNV
jgi:hypothetical protein